MTYMYMYLRGFGHTERKYFEYSREATDSLLLTSPVSFTTNGE